MTHRVARNFLRGFILAVCDVLHFAGTNLGDQVNEIGFYCWELIFAMFPDKSSSFLLSTCNEIINSYIFSSSTIACVLCVKPVTGVLFVILIVLFLNVRDKL